MRRGAVSEQGRRVSSRVALESASSSEALAPATTLRGGRRLAEGSSSHISWCVHCECGFFIYIDVGHEAPLCRTLLAPAGELVCQITGLKFFFGVPVLVPVRASPVPSVVRGSFVVRFFFELLRKKENRQPKGGMGGRHAATTQGF